MVFSDLIRALTQFLEEDTMLAQLFCHTYLTKSLSWLHTKTRNSLINHVQSLLRGHVHLTLTSVGRSLAGRSKVKHKINRCWRFLSNKKIHKNELTLYQSLCAPLLAPLNELLIAIDWTGCCSPDTHMLRASLVHLGRSIPLYNEVHPQKALGTDQVHKQFLIHLKEVLPAGKRVVIITDAGFKTPWFTQVSKLGWYFTGRVSGTINYRLLTDKKWSPLKTLHNLVQRGQTCYVGVGRLAQDSKTRIEVLLTTYWGEKKGRKNLKPNYPQAEKRYAKMHKQPVIIASNLHTDPSLDVNNNQHSVAILAREIYSKRMQIEQNFRDDKSARFGAAWRFSRTKDINKIRVLILIATIATLILWMIGFAAEKKKLHYHFQANTIRTHRVLSFISLAKQLVKHGFYSFNIRKFSTIISLFQLEHIQISPFNQMIKGR